MKSFFKAVLPAIILISVLGFFVYSFNINNPLFWDDDDWIIGNQYVHSFSNVKELFTENMLAGFGLNSNYYRPLLSMSFAFNYVLGGTDPVGYHLVSNIFHIGNAILIFLILFRLLGNKPISILTSIIWLIHPIHVESVAYISGRGDPMYLFFVLLVLNIFTKKDLVTKDYLMSGAIFLAGLLSRETAIFLPALIILVRLFISTRDKFVDKLKDSFRASILFWIIAVLYFTLRLTVLNFDNTLDFYNDSSIYSENIYFRILTFFTVFIRYLFGFIWPIGLHMEPNVPMHTSVMNIWVISGMLLFLSIILIGYYLIRNKKEFGYIWASGWTWFFITISPASGIIPINAVMYYHWLYAPMLGLALILAYSIFNIYKGILNKAIRTFFIISLVIYFGFWTVMNIKLNILWGNEIKFYEDLLGYNPKSLRVINNLANAYSEKGNLNKAKELYLRAIDDSGNIFAQPYYNLGNIYKDEGNLSEAIKMYEMAIKVDPNFHFTYTNLAVVYISQGNLNKALEYMTQAYSLKPQDGLLLANIGIIKIELGDKAGAKESLNGALNLLNPDSREYNEVLKLIDSIK